MQKSQPLIRIGQINTHLGDIGILKKTRVKLAGGFSHENHSNIELGHFRGCRPIEKSDQVKPLLDAGIGLLGSGNQLFGKINNERDPFPFLFLLRNPQEEPAEQGSQAHETPRWTRLVKVGVLDIVVHLEPFEKPLLHLSSAEAQAIADVIKEQAGAFRKKPAHQESLERDIIYTGTILDREKIENIPMQNEKRIGAAIPAASQFESPTAQWQTA